MAIRAIPNINGPSFGGYIYGLSFQTAFDTSASKLVISIVNEQGIYNTPVLNTAATVTIGEQFRFNGYIYDYTFSEKIGQKTLDVVLIDKSILLDRIAVVLFKRGILGQQGDEFIKVKEIKVTNPNPQIIQAADGSYQIEIDPQEKTVSIARKLRRLSQGNFNVTNGGYILVGEEQFIDGTCDIPDVRYNFTMLKSASKGLLNDMIDLDPEYTQTYEGTLRGVLQNWCADFGFTFYWDWSLDKLFFVDLREGINNLPDIQSCFILDKTTSESLDGTFKQYGVATYAKPINKLNSAQKQTTTYIPYVFGPFPVDYLNGGMASTGKYGGTRSKNQFINSCILAYYHSGLRKIYNIHFASQLNEVVGITKKTFITSATAKAILEAGFPNILQSFTKYQNQFDTYIGIYDSSREEKWETLEAEVASNFIGKYYRGLGIDNSVIRFCTDTFIYNYSYQISPQGTRYDGKQNGPVPFQNLILNKKAIDASNCRIFTRSGAFSHSSEEFYNELKLNNYSEDDLLSYGLIILPLDGAALGAIPDSLKTALNVSNDDLRKYSLIIIPHTTRVKQNLQINFNEGRRQNRREPKLDEQQNEDNTCDFTDSDSLCLSAEEEARKIAFPDQDAQQTPPPEGLVQNVGEGLTISLGGNSVSVVAPADGNYQGVVTITESLEVLLSKDNIYQSFGNIGDGAGVAEIRVAVDNVTDDFLDEKNITPSDLKKAQTMESLVPRKTIQYTTSDLDNSLPISVVNGIESFDITVNENGLSVRYGYGNKPKMPPQLDIRLRAVESRINRATLGAN